MNNQTESDENNEQDNLEDTANKERSRGRSRKRSSRAKSSAKSTKRSLTRRQENNASPPLRKSATAQRNGSNDDNVEPKDATQNKAAKKTSHQEIVTNAGLILTAATKRKDRDSSAYDVETRLMEYEASNEDLKTKIEEMREISMKSQKTSLDSFRAIQCQKAMN